MSTPTPGRTSAVRRALLAVLGVVVAVVVVAGLVVLAAWWSEPVDPGTPSAPSSRAEVVAVETPSEVVASATTVLQTWGRRGLDYPWWWAGLRPLLSPGARAAYAHTDPDRLPELGEVRAVEQQLSATTATVWFSTDAGRFGVDLSRAGGDGGWRAHRILFPGQESVFG